MRSQLFRGGVVTLAASLVLAACGGSPTSSKGGDATAAGTTKKPAGDAKAAAAYEQYAALTGDDRRSKLKEAAEKEGELVIYTSMTSDVAEAVVDAFEDTYDVDVSLYRAGSETVLQRILQEQKAGFAGNDIVETNALEMFALEKEAVLQKPSGDLHAKVADAGKFPSWTATRFNIFAPSWNTKLVPKGQEPKTWEELADPKWKGKLSMELGDYDWFLTLYGHFVKSGKSEQEAEQLFRAMAANSKIVKGHTVQGELMSAGQFAVTVSNYTYLVKRLTDEGAPVAYQPLVEPVIVRPNGVAAMKTATHPAAALLFTDWLLTDGQKVLVEEGLTPSVAGLDKSLDEVEAIPVDLEKMTNEGEKWSKLYEDVLKGGTELKK